MKASSARSSRRLFCRRDHVCVSEWARGGKGGDPAFSVSCVDGLGLPAGWWGAQRGGSNELPAGAE